MGSVHSGGPAAANVMIHPSDSHSNMRSCLSAYLHCCLQLLTSAATSRSHKHHWLWSSHISHSELTFHQPLWTASQMTTMITCIETHCPLPPPFILLAALRWLPALCQWQCRRYLFSADDINRKGTFLPAFQKWMEFRCSVLGLQFPQRMGTIHEGKIVALQTWIKKVQSDCSD